MKVFRTNKQFRLFFMPKATLVSSLLFISTIILSTPMTASAAEDMRQYAHGISCITDDNGNTDIIYSQGHGEDDDGNWDHDVYKAVYDSASPSLTTTPKVIISADEAQEPVSASQTADGNTIVSFEDGYDAGDYDLYQRYAIYDNAGNVIAAYPKTIGAGGHSGHTASTDDYHAVVWNEGWIDGGGINNLGTGDDIYVTSMTSDGRKKVTKNIAVSANRDGWPLAAGSDDKVLIVWQRYDKRAVKAHLCYRIYDPEDESITATHSIKCNLKPYNYNVVWVPDNDTFAVAYTNISNKGNIALIDEDGTLTENQGGFPSFVREAKPIVSSDDDESYLICPTGKKYVSEFKIDGNDVTKEETHYAGLNWSEQGTCGFNDKDGNYRFVTLNPNAAKAGKCPLTFSKLFPAP